MKDFFKVRSKFSRNMGFLAGSLDSCSPFEESIAKDYSLSEWYWRPRLGIPEIEACSIGGEPCRLLVLGEAGIGKTTLAKKLVIDSFRSLADSEIKAFYPLAASLPAYFRRIIDDQKFIPLDQYLLLPNTNPWYSDYNAQEMSVSLTESAQQHWRHGRALVILQGYEQVYSMLITSSQEDVSLIRQVYSHLENFIETLDRKHALIITSRPLPSRVPVLKGLETLELMPFNDSEREEFVRSLIKTASRRTLINEEVEKIWIRIRREIQGSREFGESMCNPEFASIVVWQVSELSSNSNGDGNLLEKVSASLIQKRLDRWASHLDLFNRHKASGRINSDKLRNTMRLLAEEFDIAGGNHLSSKIFENILVNASRDWAPRKWIDYPSEYLSFPEIVVMGSGLLVEERGSVRFKHQHIRNSLCNGTHRVPGVSKKEAISEYLIRLKASLTTVIGLNTEQYIPLDAEIGQAHRHSMGGTAYPYSRPSSFLRPRVQMVSEELSRSLDELAISSSEGMPDSPTIRDVAATLVKAKDPIVLLGSPGAGKSLTLTEAAKEIAEDYGGLKLFRHPKVPVLVRLGEFRLQDDSVGRSATEELWAYLLHQLGGESPIAPFLKELENEGRIAWFFDAMDEMSREDYERHTEVLSQFAFETCLRGNNCILSCRKTDFISKIRHQTLILLPFNQKQIASLFEFNLRNPRTGQFQITVGGLKYTKAIRLANKYNSQEIREKIGQDNIGNPFLLNLLCKYLLRNGEWPQNRLELLQSFLEGEHFRKYCENKVKRGLTVESGEEFSVFYLEERKRLFERLSLLAYQISIRNQGCYIPESELLDNSAGQKREETLKTIQGGRDCGILAALNEKSSIGFQHHRYDEYFTALHLSRNREEIDWMEKLDSPRWQETMQNLILLEEAGGSAFTTMVDAITLPLEAKKTQIDEYRKSEDKAKVKPIGFDEEIDLALRVEVAGRIVGQAHGAIPRVALELLPAVRNAIQTLGEIGRDATIVRMMYTSQHLPPGDSIASLTKAAELGCKWVRREAFKLLVMSHNFRSHIGASQDVHALSLAEGKFFQNLGAVREVLKKTEDVEVHRAAKIAKICFACECLAVPILLALLALLGPFWPTFWRWGPDWWEPVHRVELRLIEVGLTSLRPGVSLAGPNAHLILTSVSMFVFAVMGATTRILSDFTRKKKSSWALGAIDGAAVFIALNGGMIFVPLVASIYSDFSGILTAWVAGVFFLACSLLIWRNLFAVVRSVCLVCYTLSMDSRPQSNTQHLLFFYIRRVWVGVFGGQARAGLGILFCVIGLLVMAMIPVLLPMAIKGELDLHSLRVTVPVIVGISLFSVFFLRILRFVTRFLKGVKSFILVTFKFVIAQPKGAAVSLAVFVVLLTFIFSPWFSEFSAGLPVVGEKFSWIGTAVSWIGKIIGTLIGAWVLLCMIIAIVFQFWNGIRWMKKHAGKVSGLWEGSWPHQELTGENWVERMKLASVEQQYLLIDQKFRRLNISLEDSRKLLEMAEPHVKGDPAQSAFGEVLMQVVERLRHDRQNRED